MGNSATRFAPNEDQVFDILRAEAAAAGKNVEYLFLPPTDALDRMVLVDGNLVGYAEAKSRTVPYTKYDTLMVDALKWDAMIAAEQRTGLPTSLFYAFSDGGIYKAVPSQVGPLPVDLSTPGKRALSLNAGVERPVVRVPRGAFVKVAQASGWPQKPTFVRPVGRTSPKWRDTPSGTVRRLERQTGGRLRPMHPGYPVSHWLRSPDGRFVCWLDVLPQTGGIEGGVRLPAWRFFGALRQEAIFTNTPVWYVTETPEGALVGCRPADCGPVQTCVDGTWGEGWQEKVAVPGEDWALFDPAGLVE